MPCLIGPNYLPHPVVDQLLLNQSRFNTHVCVGLDPDIDKMPSCFSRDVEGVGLFLSEVIKASHGRCVAFKPNISFFEAMGIPGLNLLLRLRSKCPSDTPWIIDAKRGDIGNTSRMQAKFIFDELGADATTVHPYMGCDSVDPFFAYENKLTFVLALTSNPGSNTFEKRLMQDGAPLWQHVVREATRWNSTYGNVGLVVGATHSEIRQITECSGGLPCLIPGVGTQGGAYGDVISTISNPDMVSIVSMSRSILYSDSSNNFATKIRETLDDFSTQKYPQG